MSSKAASSSSSDKPGPLMSCGLDSSPSMHDASVETPSSSASLKETLVSSYMAKEETLKALIRWTLHTVEKQLKTCQLVAQSKSHRSSSKRKLEEASKIDSKIDQKLQELKDTGLDSSSRLEFKHRILVVLPLLLPLASCAPLKHTSFTLNGLILNISRYLPCLYLLSLILTEILFPLFTAADYLNMTVSNKKVLATLDTVQK